MEAADKALQRGASFYADHHLDAGEGDPVDWAQRKLLQEPQSQPVDPHTAPAAQGLQAEGQQSAALLPVGLQGQVSAGEAGELQLEVGVRGPPHQQRAGTMLQLWWDLGKGGWVLLRMVQAHMQDREGSLRGREAGKEGTQTERCGWSLDLLAHLRDPEPAPAKHSRALSVDMVIPSKPG